MLPAPMSASTKRVMVVEDDEGIRDALCDLLAAEGFEVVPAVNGADALQRLRNGPRPDVILLDLMMPVMDGEELLHHLKEEPPLAEIPVVILTADASVAGAAERLGARAGVRKPISLSELLSVVSAHSA